VVQGPAVLNSWTQDSLAESAIALPGSIRTLGVGSPVVLPGSEYTFAGVFTGVKYPNVIGEVLDGTTDGIHNYTADWVGTVYRTDTDWSNPVVLFNILDYQYFGITYDPSNNSLWFAHYAGDEIQNRSMSGEILSSFHAVVIWPTFLAMDYADGTLWMASRAGNELYQYSRSGDFLGSQAYPGLEAWRVFGGEFRLPHEEGGVPEPAAGLLLACGLAALCLLRRRRES
jgi:hypothetical protein